jgi:hypothetical protein
MAAVGTTVQVRDTYLDPGLRFPLTGTVEAFYDRAELGDPVFVVMFDRDAMVEAGLDPDRCPPGGEFSASVPIWR